MEPDSPPNLEEEHVSDYDKRKSEHQAARDAARVRGRPEMWPVRTGIYKNGLTDEQAEPITVNGVELEGMESVIYKQIMDVLAVKKQDNADSPVVVLDIGGMYGISSIRLAKATEDLVRQGKVAYVVSNLTFNPSAMSEEEVRSTAIGLGHDDYNDFFLQNKELVHFIISDVGELEDTQLTLPSGASLRLSNNVDLIHEQNALGKSPILDSDLPALGRALSPYGIFFLGVIDVQHTVNPSAFKLGEKALLQSDVSEVDLGKGAKYRFFAKPKAPNPTTNRPSESSVR